MPRDHILEGLKNAEALVDAQSDSMGAGYLEYSIRTSFRDLCRLIGKEAARQEIAEIVNAEFERKHS